MQHVFRRLDHGPTLRSNSRIHRTSSNASLGPSDLRSGYRSSIILSCGGADRYPTVPCCGQCALLAPGWSLACGWGRAAWALAHPQSGPSSPQNVPSLPPALFSALPSPHPRRVETLPTATTHTHTHTHTHKCIVVPPQRMFARETSLREHKPALLAEEADMTRCQIGACEPTDLCTGAWPSHNTAPSCRNTRSTFGS